MSASNPNANAPQQSSSKTATPQNPTSHKSYQSLISSLSETCEAFRCTSIDPSINSMQALHSSFFQLHHDAVQLQKNQVDVEIPFDLLEAIDRGRNPEEFMDSLLKERRDTENDNNVKKDLVKGFRESLEKGLTELELGAGDEKAQSSTTTAAAQ